MLPVAHRCLYLCCKAKRSHHRSRRLVTEGQCIVGLILSFMRHRIGKVTKPIAGTVNSTPNRSWNLAINSSFVLVVKKSAKQLHFRTNLESD